MTTTQYPNGVTYTSDTVIATGDEVVTTGVTVSSSGGSRTTLTNHGTLTIGSATQDESLGIVLGSYYDSLAGLVNTGIVRSTGNGVHETYGVLSYSSLPIINQGTIDAHSLSSSRAIGIYSYFHGGAIENAGDIVVTSDGGEAFGIWNLGLNESIVNSGTLTVRGGLSPSGDPIGVVGIRSGQSTGVRIENSGTIDVGTTSGHQATVGIYLFPDSTNIHAYTSIINSGEIIADTAIYFAGGYQTALELTNSGHITGDLVLDHNFNIVHNDSSGIWTGDLHFGLDDDVLVNAGVITGAVDLGAGDDLYDGRGGSVSQSVHAGAGLDVLVGGAASDQLDGGDDSDFIVGGGGADMLTGGAGADVFVYHAASDSTSAASDTITDFVTGVDRLDFSGLAPSGVTLSSENGFTLVTAQTSEGAVVVHVSGSIGLSDILLAPTATTISGTGAADLLHASDVASTLNGLAGNDVLIGGAGSDWLDGGTGADRLYGGAGDDHYVIDDLYDRTYEEAGGGHDSVYSSASFTLLGDNVEDLYLMAGATEGAGNTGDNLIVGNELDNSLWSGGGGVDRLYGGAGNDSYYVASQNDLVFESAGGGTDTVYASSNFYLYDNIENLSLTTTIPTFLMGYVEDPHGNYFGVGNALDNVITGNYGDNLLLGGAGDDVIRGDQGNDTIYGEVGNDQLYGDVGVDYLVGGDGKDTLYGGAGADALYGGAGDDYLNADDQASSIDVNFGGHEATPADVVTAGQASTDPSYFVTDILVGGDGNDILVGASGQGDYDLMDGGSGDDIYYVDTPADLTFEAAGGGNDTVYANIVGAGYYLYANVENLILQGVTPFGVGNELDNHLTGNVIGNYLLGGAGDDVLNGKGGNDVLFGEAGADTFVFEHGTGGDVIGDFQVGIDKIDLSAIGFADYQAVVNSMHEVNGTTAIDFGNGDLVVLNGVTEAQLHAGDFILAGGTGAVVPATGATLGVEGSPVGGDVVSAQQPAPAATDPAQFGDLWVHDLTTGNGELHIPWHGAVAAHIDTSAMIVA